MATLDVRKPAGGGRDSRTHSNLQATEASFSKCSVRSMTHLSASFTSLQQVQEHKTLWLKTAAELADAPWRTNPLEAEPQDLMWQKTARERAKWLINDLEGGGGVASER